MAFASFPATKLDPNVPSTPAWTPRGRGSISPDTGGARKERKEEIGGGTVTSFQGPTPKGTRRASIYGVHLESHVIYGRQWQGRGSMGGRASAIHRGKPTPRLISFSFRLMAASGDQRSPDGKCWGMRAGAPAGTAGGSLSILDLEPGREAEDGGFVVGSIPCAASAIPAETK